MDEDEQRKRKNMAKQRQREKRASYKDELTRRIVSNRWPYQDVQNVGHINALDSSCFNNQLEEEEEMTPPVEEADARHDQQVRVKENSFQQADACPWNFDKARFIQEQERRKCDFRNEMEDQMKVLQTQAGQMKHQLIMLKNYAPFCLTCHRPTISFCLCHDKSI